MKYLAKLFVHGLAIVGGLQLVKDYQSRKNSQTADVTDLNVDTARTTGTK